MDSRKTPVFVPVPSEAATTWRDALLLVTEWKEFRMPSWSAVKKLMATPLILDGRNIYDVKELEENGFVYHCVGR